MAFGVFTLSKSGRIRLGFLLRGFLITQLILSVIMIIFCYNTSMQVLLLLKDIQKTPIYLLYFLILLQAYSMKLHYTIGLRLVTWLLHQPYWVRTDKLCTVWLVVGTLVALNGLFVCVASDRTLKTLMKNLVFSLKIGISQYLSEPSWKILLDSMQVELNCCGIERPSDWYEMPWINMDFLNEDSDLVMTMAGSDGRILPQTAPFSCCSPHILAACYHDPLQQVAYPEEDRELLSVASLHTVGCAEAMRAPLLKSARALWWFSGLVFLLQILILFLTQLLKTSSSNAALCGDNEGDGVGCLVGRISSTTISEKCRETNKKSTTIMAFQRSHRKSRRRAKTPSYGYLS